MNDEPKEFLSCPRCKTGRQPKISGEALMLCAKCEDCGFFVMVVGDPLSDLSEFWNTRTPTPSIVPVGETPKVECNHERWERIGAADSGSLCPLCLIDETTTLQSQISQLQKENTKLREIQEGEPSICDVFDLVSQNEQLQKELEEVRQLVEVEKMTNNAHQTVINGCSKILTGEDCRDIEIAARNLQNQNSALREALEVVIVYCEGDISHNVPDIVNIKIIANNALTRTPSPTNYIRADELEETINILKEAVNGGAIKQTSGIYALLIQERNRLEGLLKKEGKE